MTLLTTLYKTLIVIEIASFFIFFYTFKMKEGSLRLEEEKLEPKEEENRELLLLLGENNTELSTENPKTEETSRELLLLLSLVKVNNSELKEEKPKLEEVKVQELENKSAKLKLNDSRPQKKDSKLKQKVQELEEEEKKAKLSEKNAELKEPETELFCEPKTNVLLLKTHKTAGSTVKKLFHRFAGKKQLTVAVKVQSPKVKTFRRCSLYPLKAGYEYNIFAHHARFNYEEMKDVMPEDTTFLTVLRDPVAQFESAYSYFSLEGVYGMNISAFADLDTSLPEWSRIKNMRRDGSNGRNPNCYDLGLDPELFDDEAAILRKVRELDRQFDLVMITELFNESMILMKEKLCWDELSDVTSVKINERRAEVKVSLSSEQKTKLREKNRADQILYDYFYEKFLRLIHAFGKKKMAEEVRKLRALTEEMDELCVERKYSGLSNSPRGKVKTGLRASGQKYEVCRDILKYEPRKIWIKLGESKFGKVIKCED